MKLILFGSLACLAVVSFVLVLFIKIPIKDAGPMWVTQRDLTTEGLGAAVMHLRQAIVLSESLETCLKVPRVPSTHGYYVSSFFKQCSWRPAWALRKCKVKLSLENDELRYWLKGSGSVELSSLRLCQAIEVLDPQLRDYENRYNTTSFLFKNLQRRNKDPLNCQGFDTVFHFRFGDIAKNKKQKRSKQVHQDSVRKLVQDGVINETRLLIVTEPSGEKHIASQFPEATFFIQNDPAALKSCVSTVKTFVGGGSTYAYVIFQMLKPEVVYTSNLDAPSRVTYPANITIELPRDARR